MALAGTKWVIWHPNPNGITFNTGGTCVYGPFNGTFTEQGQTFQAKVNCMPYPDPNYLYTEFDGSHDEGKGKGMMKNVWRPGFNPPDPGPTPFTMTKVPQ